MNVGAKSITDYGLYFQWGDTKGYTADQVGNKEDGKKPFADDYSDYKWYGNETSAFTKYYSGDNKTVLELQDDAVRANWGGSWRMPTTDEFQKLSAAVTTEWTDSYNESGVAGMTCTTKDGKQLFFPACGYACDVHVTYVDSLALYWQRSLNSSSVYNAYGLTFNNGFVYWQNDNPRCYGFAVRGVLTEN